MSRLRNKIFSATFVWMCCNSGFLANAQTSGAVAGGIIGGGAVVAGGYQNWGQAITATGDYLRWIGKARLETAEAAYTAALAAQESVRAAALARSVKTMEQDLARLNHRLKSLERQQNIIASHLLGLKLFVSGNVNSTTHNAVRYLLALLPSDVLLELFGVSEAPKKALALTSVPPISAKDFELLVKRRSQYNTETRTIEFEDVVLEDFAGGNVLMFADWLGRYEMRAVAGSQGHQQLVLLRKVLENAGTSWLESLEKKWKEQRDDQSGIWNAVYWGPQALLPSRTLAR